MMSLNKYINEYQKFDGFVVNFDDIRLSGRCSHYPPLRHYRSKFLGPLEICELSRNHHIEPCYNLRYRSLCRYFDNVISKDVPLNNYFKPGYQFELTFD